MGRSDPEAITPEREAIGTAAVTRMVEALETISQAGYDPLNAIANLLARVWDVHTYSHSLLKQVVEDTRAKLAYLRAERTDQIVERCRRPGQSPKEILERIRASPGTTDRPGFLNSKPTEEKSS